MKEEEEDTKSQASMAAPSGARMKRHYPVLKQRRRFAAKKDESSIFPWSWKKLRRRRIPDPNELGRKLRAVERTLAFAKNLTQGIRTVIHDFQVVRNELARDLIPDVIKAETGRRVEVADVPQHHDDDDASLNCMDANTPTTATSCKMEEMTSDMTMQPRSIHVDDDISLLLTPVIPGSVSPNLIPSFFQGTQSFGGTDCGSSLRVALSTFSQTRDFSGYNFVDLPPQFDNDESSVDIAVQNTVGLTGSTTIPFTLRGELETSSAFCTAQIKSDIPEHIHEVYSEEDMVGMVPSSARRWSSRAMSLDHSPATTASSFKPRTEVGTQTSGTPRKRSIYTAEPINILTSEDAMFVTETPGATSPEIAPSLSLRSSTEGSQASSVTSDFSVTAPRSGPDERYTPNFVLVHDVSSDDEDSCFRQPSVKEEQEFKEDGDPSIGSSEFEDLRNRARSRNDARRTGMFARKQTREIRNESREDSFERPKRHLKQRTVKKRSRRNRHRKRARVGTNERPYDLVSKRDQRVDGTYSDSYASDSLEEDEEAYYWDSDNSMGEVPRETRSEATLEPTGVSVCGTIGLREAGRFRVQEGVTTVLFRKDFTYLQFHFLAIGTMTGAVYTIKVPKDPQPPHPNKRPQSEWMKGCSSPKLWKRLLGHRDVITSLNFSLDGLFLMSASQDGTLCIWNPISGARWRTVRMDTPIYCAKFAPRMSGLGADPDPPELLVSSGDHTLKLMNSWTLKTYGKIQSCAIIEALCILPELRHVLAGFETGHLGIVKVKRRNQLQLMKSTLITELHDGISSIEIILEDRPWRVAIGTRSKLVIVSCCVTSLRMDILQVFGFPKTWNRQLCTIQRRKSKWIACPSGSGGVLVVEERSGRNKFANVGKFGVDCAVVSTAISTSQAILAAGTTAQSVILYRPFHRNVLN